MGNSPRRARRRRDLARMKRKAKMIYPWDTKAKDADHLAVCSCMGCGNPRRHFGGETLQERKARLEDELDDIWREI